MSLRPENFLRYERNEHGELTHFKNGDRFVYAKKPIYPASDRFTKIAGRLCRIYHDGQFNKCKVCGDQGHKTGDTVCPAYITETLKIETFFSYEHPLSNFYPCDVLFRGNNIAQRKRDARHSGVTKAISRDIPIENSKQWEASSESIIQEILKNKFTQNPDLLVVLEETSGKLIAQTTQDCIWGTGLDEQLLKQHNTVSGALALMSN